ncbi:MAG: SMP-30/gluconolactonase/LRE family protein [Caulobacteraceae bacterium]
MPVELLLDAHAIIAESPLWVPGEGVLYWMDIKAPALHRLDPQSLAQHTWPLPADIGAFALREGGEALVALRTGLHILTLADGALELVAPPPFDPELHRFNEGACDGAGRFWVGVMFDPLPGAKEEPARSAGLSSWSPAEGLVRHADFAELHNGMAWSPAGSIFYLSHSRERTVYAIDFDPAAGRLGERRAFAVLPPGEGIPDGAAVDETGAYWCAVHGASCLHRYSASGELIEEVALPVSQPTMCAFGGADLETLFITSASEKLTAEQRRREPHAGGIFHYRPGVRGTPRACHVH